MTRSSNIFKRLIGNFLGLLFFLMTIIFLVCLFNFLYFPSKSGTVPEERSIDKFSMSIDHPLGAEHFHILDEQQYSNTEDAPVCLQCHGNFCHTKSSKLRSFYNMHTFYLACETCHIRTQPGDSIDFKWFDDKSGDVINILHGDLGRYNAKIVPVKAGGRFDKFPLKQLAMDYMINKNTYSEKKKNEIQKKLMGHISEKALTCKECHTVNGYLNFSQLGYSRLRSDRLTNLEIIQLLGEYKEFYLPTMFDPSKAGKQQPATGTKNVPAKQHDEADL